MSFAYVDASWLIAIGLGERGSTALANRMNSYDVRVSSNLLEAEVRAAFAREQVAMDPELIGGISWIMPDAPLSTQIGRVLATGYLRGADLWHVACALSIVESPQELAFLTLDQRQRAVAHTLGFPV